MYFVVSGPPPTGAPPLLKTRRHMCRDATRKLCRKLQEQGWRHVNAHWGEGVEIQLYYQVANCILLIICLGMDV
jgi:hypothetical protein